jgi:hypothetical protein
MRWCVLASAALLAACQVTVFQQVPSGAGDRCPGWAPGVWSLIDGEEPGFHAEVAGDCRATLWMREQDGWRQAATRLLIVDELVFVRVADTLPLFAGARPDLVPEGHFGWRVLQTEPVLELAWPDHGALAEAVAGGSVRGRAHVLEEVRLLELEDDPGALVDRLGPDMVFSQTSLMRLQRVDRLPDGVRR